jgi:hypothetical protein
MLGVVLGGIYSPQPPNNRWGRLLSMGAPDTVRCASHVTQPLGFWSFWPLEALSSSGTGHALFSVRCASDLQLWLCAHCSSLFIWSPRFCSRPLREVAVAPLVHRTVRWIIVERTWRNPRVAGLALYGPGAPNTVLWHTGQSGAPDHSTFGFFAPLYLNP